MNQQNPTLATTCSHRANVTLSDSLSIALILGTELRREKVALTPSECERLTLQHRPVSLETRSWRELISSDRGRSSRRFCERGAVPTRYTDEPLLKRPQTASAVQIYLYSLLFVILIYRQN